jgi:hypothetical protein
MTSGWTPVAGAEATWRLAVPGGWLYQIVSAAEGAAPPHVALCFVPDPKATHVVLPPSTRIEPEGTART